MADIWILRAHQESIQQSKLVELLLVTFAVMGEHYITVQRHWEEVVLHADTLLRDLEGGASTLQDFQN